MLKVSVVSGKKLMVQANDDVELKEFSSYYSMGKYIEQLHRSGAISNHKFKHLSTLCDKNMNQKFMR